MTDPRPRQRVRFRAPTRVRGGGRYNPGEHAEFDAGLADYLVSQRLADPVEPPATTAPDEPPVHRMMTAAPAKKGARRG